MRSQMPSVCCGLLLVGVSTINLSWIHFYQTPSFQMLMQASFFVSLVA